VFSGMNLFTYGTLMDPAVWARVAREACECRRAVLHGYEARKLRGVSFPGLVKAPGGRTEGLLYLDVSAKAMARLDAYEDDFYTRITSPVELGDGKSVEAQAYLIMPENSSIVLPEQWFPPQ
jgi:gamma-glutamylcyclotransferase (GGCT)/AIG2-like uncharacterized protein YtfP